MKTANLIHLSFRLTETIDSGKSLPLAETEKAIEQGTIFNLLGDNIPDFKTFISQDDKTFLLQEWQKILSAYSSRKFGVSKSGYCLILAYCLQVMLDIADKW
jgi:hypothetical protein